MFARAPPLRYSSWPWETKTFLDSSSAGRRCVSARHRVEERDQLVAAIHAVAGGGSVFDPKVVEALVAENARSEESPLNELTPREREVLKEIVGGSSNKEIGRDLHLSPRTVEAHRAHIMTKLGAKNAADLVRIALGQLRGR